MLKNSKFNRASIHYSGVKNYRIEKFRLLGLVTALKNGSQEAGDEIILGHIALALSMAARYAYTNKKVQDITGVAMVALCDAVDRVRRGVAMKEYNEIDRYIQTYVSGKITNFLKVDHTVRPPLESDWLKEEYNKHGREILWHYFGCHSLDKIQRLNEQFSDTHIGHFIKEPGTSDPYAKKHIKEILHSKQFTHRERYIMNKKVEGYTDEEIGKLIGMSTSSITKIRLGLKERVMRLIK